MDSQQLKPGMLVSFHQDPVEVLEVDSTAGRVQVRRTLDGLHFTANCLDLYEDPQLHTDCQTYY
ncbi:hypothetical protein LJ739_10075 [Aestuariibacter halophilus]|uniref:Uncharacterized protein n=1 Tax=Fluctibacter halophilus TaxID=226011 RepID=A0ABS8G7T2_9ALTE|nr:hypothetical protein [Aestuariibacter halophilus]MCC2616588.1 hypothetical protein [Aestuariibacter halophilus]